MKKRIILFMAMAATIFASCQKDNGTANDVTIEKGIYYVLNNGSMGQNNSNVGIYNLKEKTFAPDVFFSANNINLGDTGQDIIDYGDDIYIAVTGSKIIFVTDKNLKVKKSVSATLPGSSEKLSPRRMTAANGKVYVTYYEGFLGEINTVDYSVRVTKVGPSPEGLAFCKGKVYVANSGGANYPNYDNTLSVVDAENFKEIKKLTVNLNPEFVAANRNETFLFVSSKGNYGDVLGTLQAIKVADESITDLKINNLSWMAMGENKLFMMTGGYDENWNPLPGNVITLDASMSSTETKKFVTDNVVLKNAYSLSVSKDGYVFVGCSDYKTNGDIFVFSPNGTLHDKFDSQGLNPHKIL